MIGSHKFLRKHLVEYLAPNVFSHAVMFESDFLAFYQTQLTNINWSTLFSAVISDYGNDFWMSSCNCNNRTTMEFFGWQWRRHEAIRLVIRILPKIEFTCEYDKTHVEFQNKTLVAKAPTVYLLLQQDISDERVHSLKILNTYFCDAER